MKNTYNVLCKICWHFTYWKHIYAHYKNNKINNTCVVSNKWVQSWFWNYSWYNWIRKYINHIRGNNPDSKVHVAHMEPTWVLSAPGGPRVGPMNPAIRECKGSQILPVIRWWYDIMYIVFLELYVICWCHMHDYFGVIKHSRDDASPKRQLDVIAVLITAYLNAA